MRLTNSLGQRIHLGKQVGKGGEGIVFEVMAHPSLLAKIYHQAPLSSQGVAKLDALVSCSSPELDAIAAWPQSVLYNAKNHKPCGILMRRVVESRHLHELYGTYNRRTHFPEVKWHHLILAARNVAAAFDSLHSTGIVVGDVNQGNLMVDQRMCVRFIDCDSFQIRNNGTVFHCPVGTPHFTPPELQFKTLRELLRTPDHDRFGMAVLIFHLLFVGRHPFAGRYRGAKELTIEQAIAQRRFAFSANKKDTLFDPPPTSLLLEDLPKSLADLFERAFCVCADEGERPSAQQWAEHLDAVIRRRKACSFDPAHIFCDRLKHCPWCRIEEEGGPAFFVEGGETSIISQDRVDAFNRRIRELKILVFPDFSPQSLFVPHVLRPKPLVRPPKMSRSDVAAMLIAVSIVLCVLSVAPGPLGIVCGLLGTACALVGGGYLWLSNEGRGRRGQVFGFTQRLARIQDVLHPRLDAIWTRHQARKSEYDKLLAEFRSECTRYQAEGEDLAHVLTLQRAERKNQFLAKHLIHDNVANVAGLSSSMASMLQSFGVDSALDIDNLYLSGVPGMGPILEMELLRWREQVEATYVHDGVTVDDVKSTGEAAVRRFKVSQAPRILRSARQLDILAELEINELQRATREFDEVATKGRQIATELKDFESGRRRLERLLNRSPSMIIGVVAGIQLLGAVLILLFR